MNYYTQTKQVGDCVEWTGRITPKGYGHATFRGRNWPAHRIFWTLEVGEIPEGFDLHHLCGNKRCVRTDHLEPISHDAHSAYHKETSILKAQRPATDLKLARTHCPHGHPFTPENIDQKVYARRGYRRCNECRRQARMAKYWRDKSAPTTP